MSRVGIRVIVAVVAAALAAGTLTACGGSDSTTGSTAASTESSAPAQGDQSQQSGSSGGSSHGADGDSDRGQGSNQASSGDSGSVATPLKVSGGGSSQFQVKGGDNSIQNYGEEGGESELEEAAKTLHEFYVARAEEDWSTACGYLGETVTRQLTQLASQSPELKGKGCAAALHAFTRPLPASVRRETTIVDAGSLRSDGEQAFLIYYGEGHTAYAMPMKEEGSGWKLGLLSATPLG